MQRLLWLCISVLIIFADQYSKWIVTQHVMMPQIYGTTGYGFFEWYTHFRQPLIPYGHVYIAPNFNIVMAWNTGVSFSMFSGFGPYMAKLLIAVALFITALFSYWLYKAKNSLHGICYALVIGGALGNVIDRARYGAVIDFLDFHAFDYHWPAFNIADMSIVCGISMLIIGSLFFDINSKGSYRKQQQKRNKFGS